MTRMTQAQFDEFKARQQQVGPMRAEAQRQTRQGLQDDPLEAAFQLDGLQQARLILMREGYDPRLFMPIDNGSPSKAERARRQNMGCVFDVPDMFLAIPYQDQWAHTYAGLWIENKRPGRKPDKDQQAMIAVLEKWTTSALSAVAHRKSSRRLCVISALVYRHPATVKSLPDNPVSCINAPLYPSKLPPIHGLVRTIFGCISCSRHMRIKTVFAIHPGSESRLC